MPDGFLPVAPVLCLLRESGSAKKLTINSEFGSEALPALTAETMSSLEELKNALKDTLAARGSLGQIQARVRAEIFNALEETVHPQIVATSWLPCATFWSARPAA